MHENVEYIKDDAGPSPDVDEGPFAPGSDDRTQDKRESHEQDRQGGSIRVEGHREHDGRGIPQERVGLPVGAAQGQSGKKANKAHDDAKWMHYSSSP